MNKYLAAVLLPLLCVAVLCSCGVLDRSVDSILDLAINSYETERIEDYGKMEGGSSESQDRARMDFELYFPKEIDESFSDVHYHFFQAGPDAVCYEMNLNFVIEDTEEFWNCVESIAPVSDFQPFAYDENYLEYLHEPHLFHINHQDVEKLGNGESLDYYWIDSAIIERTLIQPDEHRIMIEALRVSRGGGSNTRDLNYFFSFFHIDPSSMVSP